MVDVTKFNDTPSIRKALKSLTAKVARLNMSLKKAKGTDKEQARQAAYNEAVADREALRSKLKELVPHAGTDKTSADVAEGKTEG